MMKLLFIIISIIFVINVSNSTPTLQLSGYFNVNETTNANLFYLFYESQNSPSTDPLILWLTGGPGCSSLMAAFYENGPYFVNDNLTLSENPNSWNMVANVLYVDSPLGAGFSYVVDSDGYSTTETEISENLYSFLTQFLSKYPKYSKLPLYIFGESYAGHYVPSFSYYIYQKNLGLATINLKGLAIGNGMVDPYIQYGSLGPFAYAHGMLDINALKETEGLYESCQQAIDSGDYNMTTQICNNIMDIVQEYAGNFNVYDVSKTCYPNEPLCYNFTAIIDYLNLASTKQSFGVLPNSTWNVCSTQPYSAIIRDWFNTPINYIPTLLENYKVLVYNGNYDWICNFLGSTEWTSQLKWKYNQEFNNSPRKILYINGNTISGYSQSYDNLTMQVLLGASHMAPREAPVAALAMVESFIQN
ncbi:peptidase S10 family protein [Dictyostelium discoideum AX4]|uniref:Serine carboxypeptidase S10 family member 1 n=1 Tax=Dictyostelium discoideum TaxID=44689 RepID=SCPL1_DICDI|nr:peptidase S10 family protein [Dictyostelium discoideum AX4]Q54DY7.1 RecName: Full=Serine carboxypeptidase S10 family member 1; Flags: Precursor [Dictyostelium discoideum]EAL61486.1 peptidase S10 family protein [Dictyostelium discoideum AX4]|eukprot:XP_629909.1 peptidase S10 family protein [Dictyostelium discoideum AX4]